MADLFSSDDIFTLILIVLAIGSAIAKAVSKAKPKAKKKVTPAAGELQKKLKGFFADIQEKLEAQSRKSDSTASQWDQLKRGDRAGGPPTNAYELSLEDLVLEEEEEPEKPVGQPPRPPSRVQPQPGGGKQPESRAAEPLSAKTALTPEALRNAVIWSEILGPPVALRDFSAQR